MEQKSPAKLDEAPTLSFKADPHLLHLCVMDSLMPSPSRQIDSSTEPLHHSLALQFVDGDPISPLSKLASGTTTTPTTKDIPSPQVAWAKPLLNSSISATSMLKNTTKALLSELTSPSQWPSLAVGAQTHSKKSKTSSLPRSNVEVKGTTFKDKLVQNSTQGSKTMTESSEAEKTKFPWSARMSPGTRNLHRTANPTYLEDGTPKVLIPDHILLQGLENQKEYILGQFYRCSIPPGGLVNTIINRLWGRKCSIFSRRLGESTYLFHIPDVATRSWVLSRGLWHVDECLMFVAPWTPSGTLELPEISTYPVWVKLKNVPCSLFSIPGVEVIASGLGEPMLSHKPRLDPTMMGEAKIMVEMELNKPFPPKVAAEDKNGNISMVDVEYAWIPQKCCKCGELGHKSTRCPSPNTHLKIPEVVHETTTSVLKQNGGKNIVESSSKSLPMDLLQFSPTTSLPIRASNSNQAVTDGTHTLKANQSALEPGWSQVNGVTIPIFNAGALLDVTQQVTTQTTSTMSPTDASSTQTTQLPNNSTTKTTSKQKSEAIPLDTQSKDCIPNDPSLSQFSATIEDDVTSICLKNISDDANDDNLTIVQEDSLYKHEVEDVAVGSHDTSETHLEDVRLHDQYIPDMDPENIAGTTTASRSTRERKPTQKVQEMQWHIVNRGKRGRGGKGK